MTDTTDGITARQLDYACSIAKRLHLPERMLDDYCVQRFGQPLATLTKWEGSALLDELIPWQAIPDDMRRAMGQQDLPGFSPADRP